MKFPRIYLSTAFVMMLAAAVLVGLNIQGQQALDPMAEWYPSPGKLPDSMGWPFPVSGVTWKRVAGTTGIPGLGLTPTQTYEPVVYSRPWSWFGNIVAGLVILMNVGGAFERVARGMGWRG